MLRWRGLRRREFLNGWEKLKMKKAFRSRMINLDRIIFDKTVCYDPRGYYPLFGLDDQMSDVLWYDIPGKGFGRVRIPCAGLVNTMMRWGIRYMRRERFRENNYLRRILIQNAGEIVL